MLFLAVWRRNNHRADSHNRALISCLRAFALALLLGAAVHGQPVPDTILLPDSLGPLHQPYHVAFGGSSDDIYVASESSDIIVVDGETCQRIKRINTGTPVGGVLLVAQHDKLYCSYPALGRVGVIDCATNNIVGSIQVGAGPKALCYSFGSDKLYCGDTMDNTVTVIDCAADTVVRVVDVGDGLTAMAYDPTTEKVYVATADAVLAIGCQADTVVARIAEIKAAKGLCVSPRHQKLYAVEPTIVGSDTVFVVSTPADSVTATMWVPNQGFLRPRLACNDANDRLYGMLAWGGGPWYIAKFDCTGDSWIGCHGVGSPPGLVLVCDTARNRLLYLSVDGGYGYVSEYDCATLARVSFARVANFPDVLELDTVRRRVLCGGGGLYGNSVLSVLECNDDSLNEVGAVPLSGWQQLVPPCHNPVAGKLYYRWGDGGGGVGVVDEQTNRVVAQILLPQQKSSRHMEYSRTSNKLYCAASSGLAVLDGAGDSLLKLVDLGRTACLPCWYPDSNKLYCGVTVGLRRYVAVLDCYTDSVVRQIDLYESIDGLALADKNHLLGWNLSGRLTLIDCRTDSVVADSALLGNVYAATRSGNDKVYLIRHYSYDRLEVRSPKSLSLLATVDWPNGRAGSLPFLVCSDSTHKLYWFARDRYVTEQDSVLVIDTRGDTVVARLQAGFRQEFGCLDHSGRYIFSPSYLDSSLVVYDTRSDSVAAVYMTPPRPRPVLPNPELERIYVGFPDAILVYPDTLEFSGVCEEVAYPPKRLPQTILMASDVNRMGPVTWYDVTGRRVSPRTADGGRRAVSPGVYLAPGLGRSGTKIVVVR